MESQSEYLPNEVELLLYVLRKVECICGYQNPFGTLWLKCQKGGVVQKNPTTVNLWWKLSKLSLLNPLEWSNDTIIPTNLSLLLIKHCEENFPSICKHSRNIWSTLLEIEWRILNFFPPFYYLEFCPFCIGLHQVFEKFVLYQEKFYHTESSIIRINVTENGRLGFNIKTSCGAFTFIYHPPLSHGASG